MNPMRRTVLLWIADDLHNNKYIDRAFRSIHDARTHGLWKDDIVLMTTPTVQKKEEYQSKAHFYRVQMMDNINNINNINTVEWISEHSDNSFYSKTRPNLYAKLGMMSSVFKKWDTVFYIDAGAAILGPLQRILDAAKPPGFLYAHSDAYPSYEWKLTGQFDLSSLDKTRREQFLQTFDTDQDYFQSSIMIFSTSLIKESTLDDLFQLYRQWSTISTRGDQGILNLYFHCMKGVWKPLPPRDDKGFLYDFMVRDGFSPVDYVLLKYLDIREHFE